MQLLESLREMHPDKLTGVLEQHILDGESNSVRQALPSLIHQHPELRAPLQEIAERLKQSSPAYTADNHSADDASMTGTDNNNRHNGNDAAIETISGAHAKVFACGNCGGTVSKQHPDSNHVICHYCGCDAIHPPADGLARWRELLDARSRFTIGSLFNYNNRHWQVIGVQCYSGNLREWDSEDKVWENNAQNITLWWMLNEQRELAWVSDYGKSRYWSQKFIPFEPQMPANDDKTVEYGTWELMFAAGEFSYMPYSGEQRESREYTRAPRALDAPDIKSSNYSYSVETGMDENGKPEEIEFIRSSKLSNAQVLSGIGSAILLKTVRRWSATSNVFLGTIAALLIGYVLMGVISQSSTVLTATTPAQTSTPTEMGTLDIERAGESYSIELSSSRFNANRYIEVILDLEDSDGVWAGGAEVEFWRETGRDSDGPWDESLYRVTQQFRFEQPGSYLLSLTPGETNLQSIPSFTATVRSNPNPALPFTVAAIVALGLAIVSRMRSRSSAASGASITARLRRNLSVDTLGQKR